jgi:arylsulfatase A-like enzyme
MDRSLGFDRGFQHYIDDHGGDVATGARRVADLVRGELAAGRPLFVFLHTYQVHGPYRSPAAYAELFRGPADSAMPAAPAERPAWADGIIRQHRDDTRGLDGETVRALEAQYARSVRYVDDTLRQLWVDLRATGFWRDALLVITSDHGEEFGERGGLQHRGLLFEELIRVPLVLHGNRVPVGLVRRDIAGLVDVMPTILAYAGVTTPPGLQGRNLLVSPSGGEGRELFVQYANLAYAVRDGRYKLVEAVPLEEGAALDAPRKTRLYDLQDDPGERRDLLDLRPETAAHLRLRLAELRAKAALAPSAPAANPPDAEQLERLRSLGYIQ